MLFETVWRLCTSMWKCFEKQSSNEFILFEKQVRLVETVDSGKHPGKAFNWELGQRGFRILLILL